MTQDRKRPTGTHNPSASSLRRWDNEGGAPVGGRAQRPRDPNQLAKSIVDEEQGKDRAAVERGRKGGAKGGKAATDDA